MNFRFPQCIPINLKTLIPNASEEALTIMRDMLQWDPKKRPTAVQALRYPYFQVGQALGPPVQVDQKKPLEKPVHSNEPLSELKKKPSPPTEAAEKILPSDSPASQRPLQQIQLPQSTANSQLPSKAPQVALPSISNTISPKTVTNGPQNNVVNLKHGRRRWGQSVLKDSWDEFDTDFGISFSKKPSMAMVKENKTDDSLYGFTDPVPTGELNKGSSNMGNLRRDSGQATSAKQHYLRQSRYLPGTYGGHVGPSYNAAGGYMPSFHKKEVGSAGQRIQLAPIGAATMSPVLEETVTSRTGATDVWNRPNKQSVKKRLHKDGIQLLVDNFTDPKGMCTRRFTWYCKLMENSCESAASKPLRIRSKIRNVCTYPLPISSDAVNSKLTIIKPKPTCKTAAIENVPENRSMLRLSPYCANKTSMKVYGSPKNTDYTRTSSVTCEKYAALLERKAGNSLRCTVKSHRQLPVE
ncbi:unnamed protein product [Ranitomeya imitator]|uniref:Serine/threonine protein kinase n=1 Tax=Ranitomeya imitator TaxID=111125 RepID=A0ABN9LYY4_9NEOB|nr:unnamed protein product [Ranitomeya imitator]